MSFNTVTLILLIGFGNTCLIFLLTLLLALPLGLLISLGCMSKNKTIKHITNSFVWIIRGTPLMLQLFVVFYLPGIVLGIPFKSRITAALIAFVINYACYFGEIYRGGILSVETGQTEAGRVLGLNKRCIFWYIVLPQVIKRIMSPMANEIITLVKDTALVRVIAVEEIIMAAGNILSQHALLWPFFYTGAFYLIFVGALTLCFNALEKKLNYYWV